MARSAQLDYLPIMIRPAPRPAETPPPLRMPAWALPVEGASDMIDAAFFAGAAAHALDPVIRSEPVWGGVWRQRLALRAAAANVRLIGRSEDEAALRDSWCLRQIDADPGPAGNILRAWRHLVTRRSTVDGNELAVVAEWLGLRRGEALASLPGTIEAVVRSARPAPLAAAAIAGHVMATRPDAEILAWWLADLALAEKLCWARPVPLLAMQAPGSVFRAGSRRGKRIRPGEEGFEQALCLAFSSGAVEALRLAADIARYAERLFAIAPKLRAKGAGEVIRKLLNEDAVPGTLTTKTLSRFGARRLFQRLQDADAVRELSGRPAFRLYGL